VGLFSKILIVLNILAAGAFFYMGAQVYSKRQEWTLSVFRHTVMLRGLPVEGGAISGSYYPFDYQITDPVRLSKIDKSVLEKVVPAGGSELGGELVNSQSAEIKRVEQKVNGTIDAADSAPAKLGLILKYLNNLARSGPQRDGAFALLRDLFNKDRTETARRELGQLAKNPIQVDTLKTLAAIGDKSISARQAILDLLQTTAPLGITGDSKEQRDESERSIRNSVLDIQKAAGTDQVDKNALNAAKEKLLSQISVDEVKMTINSIADILQLPLSDPAQADTARKALRDIALAGGASEADKKLITALADVLMVGANDPTPQALAAGRAALQQYFDEASAPATLTKEAASKNVLSTEEKARRIAHILYHLDADKKDFATRWDWHQRVLSIVGMDRYVEAANTQAIALGGVSQRLRGIIREEESGFRSEYLNQMRNALEQADRLSGLTLEYSGLQNQKGTTESNLSERAKERENLERALVENKESAKRYLADLATREKDIFELLKSLDNSKVEMFKLEGKLRSKETGK
jgi:hypothetical protein